MIESPIVLASDHAGFELKSEIIRLLQAHGRDVTDLGTHSIAPVDYPDYAEALGKVVGSQNLRGILICGSGIGASIAANKIRGVRAGLAHDTYSAHQGVEHDDMNVLVLGARVVGVELAKDLVTVFLAARFSGEERHRRRLAKVARLDQR